MREELARRLAGRLDDLDQRGLRRELRPLEMVSATLGRHHGRELVVFSSNDYLGLAADERVRSAWRGGGAGSSRLISGSRPAHAELEAAVSEHFGGAALVFSSGYQANLAVLTTLFEAGQVVASDRLNHASIIDGLRLSRASVEIAEHGVIWEACDGVVVEGLYSMDGDRLCLREVSGWLVVDEAHAVGCLGPGGRGVAAAQGVRADVLVGTFGKAYGAAGAFVVGPEELRELLVSAGRSFVYTTALAEPAARAALAGFRAADEALRERLVDRVARLRAGLADLGLEALGRDHVVPVVLAERTMPAAAALYEAGYYVPGIRAPTVPAGQERLRISLSAAHTDDQIDGLLEALDRCCCSR